MFGVRRYPYYSNISRSPTSTTTSTVLVALLTSLKKIRQSEWKSILENQS